MFLKSAHKQYSRHRMPVKDLIILSQGRRVSAVTQIGYQQPVVGDSIWRAKYAKSRCPARDHLNVDVW